MAENNIEKTVPGSILQSQHFLIEFVAEFQKGLTGCSLEYNMSWMEMMGIILEILELFPTSVKAIEEILDGALCDWILFCGAADNIIASSKINEEIYFPPPLGSKKSLKVSFSDMSKTEVIFNIKKKTSMKTLKNIGITAIVENLKMERYITKLKIPKTLYPDIFEQFRNDFSVRYYKSNINKEEIFNQINHFNFAKKEIISNSGKQQQNKKRKIDIEVIEKKKTNKKVSCARCGKSFRKISSHKCKK